MSHPRPRRVLGAGLLGIAALALACSRTADLPTDELKVEYAGCVSVYRSPFACAPSQGTKFLKLWVPAEPGAAVEIYSDERRLAIEAKERNGGRTYSISFPLASLRVVVRPLGKGPATGWSLPIAPPESYPWGLNLQTKKAGQIGPYLEQLRRKRPLKEQGFILKLLGNQARLTEPKATVNFYQRAIGAHHQVGRVSGAIEVGTVLARTFLDAHKLPEARGALDQAEGELLSHAPAESKFLLAYNLGLLAREEGDYRRALAELHAAADVAERVGMDTELWDAGQALGSLFQTLGRAGEAKDLFRRLRAQPPVDDPCAPAVLAENWGFSQLLAREAGQGGEEDPTTELEKAIEPLENRLCATESQRFNARLNLALAYQQAGRWTKSRQVLEQASRFAGAAMLEQRFWWLDLRARELMEGHAYARGLDLYDQLAAIAEGNRSLAGRFQALFGRARCQRALELRTAARSSLAKADELIDAEASYIPLEEGRESFVAQREAATRLDIQWLLEDGRNSEALAIVRRARSRLLRLLTTRQRIADLTPSERVDWERSLSKYLAVRQEIDQRAEEGRLLPISEEKHAADAQELRLDQARQKLDRTLAIGSLGAGGAGGLAPPRYGEVILVYHPLPKGWVGFAYDEQGIKTARLDLPSTLDDPKALGQLLLEPFHARIARARRVRVLPYGPLWSVDFHALPFDRAPLLAGRQVVYSLDLPARRQAAAGTSRTALVISDPLGDLSMARQEAEEVQAAIRRWGPGWTLEVLSGGHATAPAVSQALGRASIAHYAGHGMFAGVAGWESALPLAGHSQLTVGEILTLHHVPTWIVLSSCEGSRSSPESPGEGIGLAQAFLDAGAEGVIAPVRPVDDGAARRLVRDLYRTWVPGEDPARALQGAQLAGRGQGDDWASFRFLEP